MILYNLYGRSVGAGGAKGARRARLAYGLDDTQICRTGPALDIHFKNFTYQITEFH